MIGAHRRALGATGVVLILLGLGAFRLDGIIHRKLMGDARQDAEALLRAHVSTLELAFAKRATLVEALAAWMADRPDASSSAFDAFAGSLYEIDQGARAFQRVVGGRIQDTYPLEGNESAIGLDLWNHPDAVVRVGIERALKEGRTTLSAPVRLVQGGDGIILRRSAGPPGDMNAVNAAIVVDLEQLESEAGLPELEASYLFHLDTGSGAVVHQTAGWPHEAGQPLILPVQLPEGDWTLTAVPVGGWKARVAQSATTARVTLVALVLLVGLLVYAGIDRNIRLRLAVEGRTAELQRSNTQLEQASAEVMGREELLRAALTAGRVLTWSWDVREGESWRWGSEPSWLASGATPGADLMERVHPDDRPHFKRALEDARKTGVLAQEFRLSMSDGAYTWVRAEGRWSARDDEGPVRIVGAVADISRVKELESAMLHRGRLELIGQLAGGVVHDLNNALTVVRGELEMALDNADDFPLREAAAEALHATRYSVVLLGQLLTFARKDTVKPTSFVWDEMCDDAATFLARLLGRGIRLDTELRAGDARVHMDRAHALQILTNLAANARDAMGESGVLTLATHLVEDGSRIASSAVAGPALVVEVRDTGPGIPRDVQKRMFDPFFTTKGEGRGTGLGLSTTRRVVEENGGGITFTTSAQGTTFVVVLPKDPDEERSFEDSATERASEEAGVA